MSGDDQGHAGEAHDCESCVGCIHNGRKCCGCYDGACCQSPEWTNPCGHAGIERGCGGCDPGAIEFVKDDGGPWLRVLS